MGYCIMRYTTTSHYTCLLKMAAGQSQTTTLTCVTGLAVNHPEIALTLEKCRNHCLLYLNLALFYELCDFS